MIHYRCNANLSKWVDVYPPKGWHKRMPAFTFYTKTSWEQNPGMTKGHLRKLSRWKGLQLKNEVLHVYDSREDSEFRFHDIVLDVEELTEEIIEIVIQLVIGKRVKLNKE